MSKLSSIPELKITRPGTRGSQFSWEEISMYLYGHKPVEPAVLEDQRKLVKLEKNCQGLFLWKYVLCILIPFCSFLSFFFSFIYLLFPVIYKKKSLFLFDGIFSAYGCSGLLDICTYGPRTVWLHYLDIFKLLSITNQMVVQKGVLNFLFQAILLAFSRTTLGFSHTTV